jgi:hypothetical protein
VNLDDIKAGETVVMTEGLVRLFRAAGCSPTRCHACSVELPAGSVFKLVAHTKPNGTATDEMCCGSCGEPELKRRDSLALPGRLRPARSTAGNWGGYSRPSQATKGPA